MLAPHQQFPATSKWPPKPTIEEEYLLNWGGRFFLLGSNYPLSRLMILLIKMEVVDGCTDMNRILLMNGRTME